MAPGLMLASESSQSDPPQAMLDECAARLGSQVTPEFMRAQIEVGTKVCKSITEVRADLAGLRRTLVEITARMPLGEIPLDEDVAEAVVFFCSDRARMITGETLLVNAGEILR